MKFKKRVKRGITRTLIFSVSLLAVISVALHFMGERPSNSPVMISFGADGCVEINLKNGVKLDNIPIEHDSIPGVMVFYEEMLVIAFTDPDTYRMPKQEPVIVETHDDGVTISVIPGFVVPGPYTYMPYEIMVNGEHQPESEVKLFVVFNHNDDPFSNRYRKIIV